MVLSTSLPPTDLTVNLPPSQECDSCPPEQAAFPAAYFSSEQASDAANGLLMRAGGLPIVFE